MHNILIAILLLLLGLYIDFLRMLLTLLLNNTKLTVSDPSILFISKICNHAVTGFLKLEKSIAL